MQYIVTFLALLCAAPVLAETIVAARTIRAQTVLTAADVKLSEAANDGAFASIDEVVGLEARVALYAGRPIRPGELGPPAIVDRNQVVTLVYRRAGLEILAEGRALGRAGAGDRLRVMNLQSRQTITGRVRADGVVVVGAAFASTLSN